MKWIFTEPIQKPYKKSISVKISGKMSESKLLTQVCFQKCEFIRLKRIVSKRPFQNSSNGSTCGFVFELAHSFLNDFLESCAIVFTLKIKNNRIHC